MCPLSWYLHALGWDGTLQKDRGEEARMGRNPAPPRVRLQVIIPGSVRKATRIIEICGKSRESGAKSVWRNGARVDKKKKTSRQCGRWRVLRTGFYFYFFYRFLMLISDDKQKKKFFILIMTKVPEIHGGFYRKCSARICPSSRSQSKCIL